MGWIEFKGWVRELNRQRTPQQVDPDSWDGRASDPWWAEMDRKRVEERGGVASRRRWH